MEYNYVCPRCGNSEVYFAKRQVITGFGGGWARMADTPLCKNCGEIANGTLIEMTKEQKQKRNRLAYFLLTVIGLLLIFNQFFGDA